MNNQFLKITFLFAFVSLFTFTSCELFDDIEPIGDDIFNGNNDNDGTTNDDGFAGAVYAMANGFDGNSIVAYGRNDDGTLSLIGEFPTGDLGAAFDGGEGLDPLISAYALERSADGKFLMAVNAGSNTITVFRINNDYSLTVVDSESTFGVGPNSIAQKGNMVFVTNIDEDGIFTGEPDQEGNLVTYTIDGRGDLTPQTNSIRSLGARPSAVRISPDGRYVVAAMINSGSAALASGSTDELLVYRINRSGSISPSPLGSGASTLPGNNANRNLPSAIGFEIVYENGANYVVVTEAREFQADGTPPAFPNLQTGSVSTWRLESNGSLTPINLDVITGNDFTDGERTACWIAFSNDQKYFWVSNALESTLSTFEFNNGVIDLVNRVEASGTPPGSSDPATAFANTDGWIDLYTSRDGKYLYQLYGLDGTIGVFKIDGSSLSLIEEVSGDLPEENTQGIVAF